MYRFLLFAGFVGLALTARAADSTPPAYPGPNRADEPVRTEFSLAAARQFLDSAAVDWWQSRQCFTCHTNYSYLLSRHGADRPSTVEPEVRRQLEELVERRWQEKGPRWPAEVVMSAVVLAQHDAATTGKLHPTTRKALDRMWTVQRDDGGFTWLKCEWPPMESDDHYGATIALIGVAAAPDGYAGEPASASGIARLKKYLEQNPPTMLHHKLMLLWAAAKNRDLVSPEDRAKWLGELSRLQRPDGGWNVASLGDWKREDGSPQDVESSDGYATGFALFILRQCDVPVADERIARGIAWLKANQRESGRWFTRSLFKDNKHYLSHAGTAVAVMALTACGISE
jgi:squalene-hopene/tetraprenyl-beta-curcumene cyclase